MAHDHVNVKTLGIKGDGSDESQKIKSVVEDRNNYKLYWPAGTYYAPVTAANIIRVRAQDVSWIMDSNAIMVMNPWFYTDVTNADSSLFLVGGTWRKTGIESSPGYTLAAIRTAFYTRIDIKNVAFDGAAHTVNGVSLPGDNLVYYAVYSDTNVNDEIYFDNCRFDNFTKMAYIRTGTSESTANNSVYITDCTITRTSTAFGTTVLNINPEANGGFGGAGYWIKKCVMKNTSFTISNFDGQPSTNMCVEYRKVINVVTDNCTFTQGNFGESVEARTYRVTNSTYTGQKAAAIENFTSDKSIIINNTFNNIDIGIDAPLPNSSYGDAVYQFTSRDLVFSGNTVNACKYGIWFNGVVTKFTAEDNYFNNLLQYVWYMTRSPKYISARNNMIDGVLAKALLNNQIHNQIVKGTQTISSLFSPAIPHTSGWTQDATQSLLTYESTGHLGNENAVVVAASSGINVIKGASINIDVSSINVDGLQATFTVFVKKVSTDYANGISIFITPLAADLTALASAVTIFSSIYADWLYKQVTFNSLPTGTAFLQLRIGCNFNGKAAFSNMTLDIGEESKIVHNNGVITTPGSFKMVAGGVDALHVNSTVSHFNTGVKQTGGSARWLLQSVPTAAPADTNFDTSNMNLWIDETTNNVNYKIKKTNNAFLNSVLVSENTVNTLTNKTLDSTTNSITADRMRVSGSTVSFGAVAAATTLGSVVNRLQILDNAQQVIGYIPIYNNIT